MAVNPIPVWLDCDPGHDDAFAMLLAAYHPGMNLLGISTVFGNASLNKTTNNASSLLVALGKQSIPLYEGAEKALHRPAMHVAASIHGDTGLDGTNLLPKPLVPIQPGSAVEAMALALRGTAPGTAWVVATGTTTNVAALFEAHPDIASHIAGLSIMGGAIGGGFTDAVLGRVDGVERIGNWSKYAEFNILIDPEAADSLFRNPVLAAKTTLIPLDLTHQVLATPEVRSLLLYGKGGGTDGLGKSTLRTMLVDLLMFFAKTYSDVFGITTGPPLHDPLAMAAVLTGTPFEIPFFDWDIRNENASQSKAQERFAVSVVVEGTIEEAQQGSEIGRTKATLLEPGTPGIRIPRGVDISRFWQVIEECLERADETIAGLESTSSHQ